jgi:predicted amidophosphoribosyltransferase
MARYLGVPLMLGCLVKARDTLPQVGLNSKQRRKNIRKAFEIRDRRLIKGRRILLVDDVITTGATIRECSGELKKAGAEDIYAIALAHGTRD